MVLLSPHQDNYFHLEATGQRIWDLLEDETSAADVADKLCAEYQVDADECLNQTLEFCRNLHAEGLLTIAEEKR